MFKMFYSNSKVFLKCQQSTVFTGNPSGFLRATAVIGGLFIKDVCKTMKFPPFFWRVVIKSKDLGYTVHERLQIRDNFNGISNSMHVKFHLL